MRYEEKVPNGKMVCVEVEADKGITTKVRITGDFFLHPEDALDAVESSLTGIPLDTGEEELASRIKAALKEASLIGAAGEDIARIFRRAIACGD